MPVHAEARDRAKLIADRDLEPLDRGTGGELGGSFFQARPGVLPDDHAIATLEGDGGAARLHRDPQQVAEDGCGVGVANCRLEVSLEERPCALDPNFRNADAGRDHSQHVQRERVTKNHHVPPSTHTRLVTWAWKDPTAK